MDELRAALKESIAGHGRMAMLVGEPGIGKTRTAEELASHAETQGAQVLWGRCYEEDGAPSYWPWVQAIRSYVEPRNADQLQVDLGPNAADIAEIVPEIRPKLTALETPPDLPPEQARFRLFDSVTSFLKSLARSKPLMLVLDDLHWADEPSLLLLQFLAQHLADSHILVVGCYRDVELSRQHPLSETLARISREADYQRHALRRMDQGDTALFIDAAAGTNVSRAVAEAIYSRTEGNPFFTTEVVQLLSDRGELSENAEGGPDGIRIPEGVREVIGQRFNRLSADCNLVLSTSAVIGREFTVDLLGRLIEDLTEDRLLEVLEESLSAHLIEELPPSVGRYQFTHALIQETLTDELSLTRRVRLHARIAETLETLYGSEVEAHAAELAYHFAQAEAVIGTEKLVRYSLLAGNQAVTLRAYEEALAHFQRGLTARGVALTGLEPADDEDAAALLVGLGQAQMGTHERSSRGQVVDSLTRAFDYYVNVGDSERAVTAALFDLPPMNGRELFARALALVPPDSHDAGKLQARQITALRGDYDRAQDAIDQALSIARRQHDRALELKALVSAGCVDYHHCRHAQSLEWNLQAVDLAQLVDLPIEESHARYDLQHVHHAMGDLQEAARQAEAMLAPAGRTRTLIWHSRAMDANENVASAMGDWRTARESIEQGLASSPRDVALLGAMVLLHYQLGETEAGDVSLERLLDTIPGGLSSPQSILSHPDFDFYTVPMMVISVASYITGGMARVDVAEGFARSILSSPDIVPAFFNAARIALALAAVQRRDIKAATELYGVLQPIGGTLAPQSNVGPGLAVDRLLGLLSQTIGNLDQAVTPFGDAFVFCRKGGIRPELAWTCCDYADALCQRNGPGDRQMAIDLLDESLAIASELGMRPLMERVTDRQAAMETQAVPSAYPDGLTEREVEVLRLLAQGRSNNQISQELVVADGTTRRHVANIYEKIGVANCTEATRYALREGLLSLDESPPSDPAT
jgi:ATP/maltotriose-dependent transcriptional regulator MalT